MLSKNTIRSFFSASIWTTDNEFGWKTTDFGIKLLTRYVHLYASLGDTPFGDRALLIGAQQEILGNAPLGDTQYGTVKLCYLNDFREHNRFIEIVYDKISKYFSNLMYCFSCKSSRWNIFENIKREILSNLL